MELVREVDMWLSELRGVFRRQAAFGWFVLSIWAFLLHFDGSGLLRHPLILTKPSDSKGLRTKRAGKIPSNYGCLLRCSSVCSLPSPPRSPPPLPDAHRGVQGAYAGHGHSGARRRSSGGGRHGRGARWGLRALRPRCWGGWQPCRGPHAGRGSEAGPTGYGSGSRAHVPSSQRFSACAALKGTNPSALAASARTAVASFVR